MGEYAISKQTGKEIKIGTCESMYYLRADQRHLVSALPGNVDVNNLEQDECIRFRFPFPNEDNTGPGEFEDYDRGWSVPGMEIPTDADHETVQFSHSAKVGASFLVSLPCPYGKNALPGLKVWPNGISPSPEIVQQRWINGGELWTVLRCPCCDTRWRIDKAEAERVAVMLRAHADKQTGGNGAFWHGIADRMLAGYERKAA